MPSTADGYEPMSATGAPPGPDGAPAVPTDATLGVLTLVLTQLGETERRITAKIAENARQAAGRWKDHEEEHAELLRMVRNHDDMLRQIREDDRVEDAVWTARVGPFKGLAAFAAREWRTILFAAAFVATWIINRGGVPA